MRPEVEEYNKLNPTQEPLIDPSSVCIEVTLLLMTWYRLFRRCDPPKDEEDIKELNELADWYLNIPKYFSEFYPTPKYVWRHWHRSTENTAKCCSLARGEQLPLLPSYTPLLG